MQTREVDATAGRSLLAAAVAAPSIHNTQPWRFGLDPDTRSVEVRADRSRQLPMTDPDLRAQHLSVGAAVFNLRVATAHLGWQPVVRLLPAADDPDQLARVQLATPAEGRPSSLRGLYEAVERRHTSGMPFTGRPVPEPTVTAMISAARAEGAHLDVPDIMGTRRLLQLTQAAEYRNASHPARTAEARTWLTAPGRNAPYGHTRGRAGRQGRVRADADAGLHRPAARAAPARPGLRTPRPDRAVVDAVRPAGGLVAGRPGPAARTAHRDRVRGAHLDAAPGDGVAGPAGGDGPIEWAVLPAVADCANVSIGRVRRATR